jgi:SNF2 family DNA or RNA helicase
MLEIIDNTALRFSLPYSVADNVYDAIEKCEILGSSEDTKELVLYWGYQEARATAHFIDLEQPNGDLPNITSPILRDYSWPGIHKPFAHQKDTASFLSLRPRAFCFNEAGTGKTSAAIWAADYLMSMGIIKHVLVICPVSIMYSAWQADVLKTAMHRTCAVAHGTAAKRKRVIEEGYDFTVINYDGVPSVFEELQNRFDLIIVDEANAYKSTSTKRWKTLAKLMTPSTWLWMMTGTPAAQSPVDAFGLAKLISPYRVPRFMTAWRDRVMMQVSKFKWAQKPTALNDVYYALQPAIRYTKRECLDLPELTYQTRDIPMTIQAAQYYKALKQQLLIEAAGEQVSAVNAAAALSKLLQISGGAVYTDKRDVVEFDVSPRLNALKEVIDETSNKVVVFVPYVHTIDVLVRFLNKEGITNAVIRGDVSVRARTDIVARFQTQQDPRVLVIQPQSASHGITLTLADTVVFWSPVMSVDTYIQCIGRIDRLGQVNNTTVVHLQGSDVERKMYNMLRGKVDSHQKIVDLYRQEIESINDKEVM